jgi:hypothetical protein
MTDQRDDGRREIEAETVAVTAFRAYRARDFAVPGRQLRVVGDFSEAERARPAPTARAVFLFEWLDSQQSAVRVPLDFPDDARGVGDAVVVSLLAQRP